MLPLHSRHPAHVIETTRPTFLSTLAEMFVAMAAVAIAVWQVYIDDVAERRAWDARQSNPEQAGLVDDGEAHDELLGIAWCVVIALAIVVLAIDMADGWGWLAMVWPGAR